MTAAVPLQLLLDPWSSEYPASVQADDTTGAGPDTNIDTSVETPHWSAMPPGAAPDSLAFVDGVRRLEARVAGITGAGMVYGLFASFATGAVVIAGGKASFAECRTERRLILSSGLTHSETLRAGNADLEFSGFPVLANNPADLVLGLQRAMRESEWQLATKLSTTVTFLDGPLAFVTEPPGPVVGIIKSIHRLYLGPEPLALVPRLRTGERTPVFGIQEGQKTRYSWYLRIAERQPLHHGFSGVVRLEASASAGIAAAVALANLSAGALPRFASPPGRDGRAPQNLTPVGALEQHLRDRMGDATLIQRTIERRIAQGLLL